MMQQSMVHLGRLLILLLPVAILLTDGASILGQKALADEAIYSNEADMKSFNEYPVEDIEEDYDSYAQDVPVSNLEDQDEQKYDNEVEQVNEQDEEKDNYEENPVPTRGRTDGTGKKNDDPNDKKKEKGKLPSNKSSKPSKHKKKKQQGGDNDVDKPHSRTSRTQSRRRRHAYSDISDITPHTQPVKHGKKKNKKDKGNRAPQKSNEQPAKKGNQPHSRTSRTQNRPRRSAYSDISGITPNTKTVKHNVYMHDFPENDQNSGSNVKAKKKKSNKKSSTFQDPKKHHRKSQRNILQPPLTGMRSQKSSPEERALNIKFHIPKEHMKTRELIKPRKNANPDIENYPHQMTYGNKKKSIRKARLVDISPMEPHTTSSKDIHVLPENDQNSGSNMEANGNEDQGKNGNMGNKKKKGQNGKLQDSKND